MWCVVFMHAFQRLWIVPRERGMFPGWAWLEMMRWFVNLMRPTRAPRPCLFLWLLWVVISSWRQPWLWSAHLKNTDYVERNPPPHLSFPQRDPRDRGFKLDFAAIHQVAGDSLVGGQWSWSKSPNLLICTGYYLGVLEDISVWVLNEQAYTKFAGRTPIHRCK